MAGLLIFGAGCARNYVLRLNNGTRVTATTKPKLQSGYYVFKDYHGEDAAIAQGRVLEISPASRAPDEKKIFKPQTSH